MSAPWKKIVITPVDISVKTSLNDDLKRRLAASSSKAAQFIAKFHPPGPGGGGGFMWDEISVLAFLDPSVITRQQQLYVNIDIDHGPGYGQTIFVEDVVPGPTPRPRTMPSWWRIATVQWDLDLTSANEMGLHESLQGLFPDLRREFAQFMATAYPAWLKNLEGDRPPLSIDIVEEFLLPVMQHDRAVVFIVIDCLRLDQWKVIEPVIAPLFEIETTHYFGVLPTATPYARNALFSGLFPGEIAARMADSGVRARSTAAVKRKGPVGAAFSWPGLGFRAAQKTETRFGPAWPAGSRPSPWPCSW